MKYMTRKILANFVCIIIFEIGMTTTVYAQVKIGIFADCQYCDCEPAGIRFYQNSLGKLDDCIADFNADTEIDFVVGLGDLIDKEYSSCKAVNSVLAKSANKVYQVTGNHDYSVKSEYFDEVPKQLNLKNTYYSIEHNKWQFIFLNGNDITLHSNDKETVKQAKDILAELTRTNQPNNKEWNGGIGQTQISWLKTQLKNAEKKNLNVVLFCHYPLLPLEAHALWNSTEVLSVIEKYSCVKAWINGHNHAGNYAMKNGLHFITLKGMVDTKTKNAYSFISLTDKEIKIKGIGREQSRKLPVR